MSKDWIFVWAKTENYLLFLKKISKRIHYSKKYQVLTNQHINREINQHEDDLLIRDVQECVGIPEKPIDVVEHQMAVEVIKKTENFIPVE